LRGFWEKGLLFNYQGAFHRSVRVGRDPVKRVDQKEENLMGVGGISIWQLLIVLVIVLLLFGTKKLRNMGGDLGGAIKGFRSSMKEVKGGDSDSDSEDPETADQQAEASQDDLADVEATEDVKTEKV
tara:strand:+ start:8699 stop:9079 length:381 start_codon:yes stop_codon:yes gene_type:complete